MFLKIQKFAVAYLIVYKLDQSNASLSPEIPY